MLIHKDASFKIYFGTRLDNIYPADYLDLQTTDSEILQNPHFASVKTALKLQYLTFLKQTHSVDGFTIKNSGQKPFTVEGDFLVTHQPNYGIGVMTADCLPIVIHDKKNKAVAIAHAGWKGSIAGVACKTVHAMQQEYGSLIPDLQIFFGPAANACCYEVGQEFKELCNRTEAFRAKDNQLYFDVPLLNSVQLFNLGIKQSQINTNYNYCTMCDQRFFSHRRDKSGRQMTVVNLSAC